MRVLLSAYSSDARRGSESLVGHHYARILSERHDVTLITCAPTTVDFLRRVEAIDLGERNLNEVGRRDLLAFEIAQLPRARRIVREERIDLIHRAAPVSINDPTTLCYLAPRFLIGPIHVSGEAPPSFTPYIHREIVHYKRQTPLHRRVRPLDRIASATLGLLWRKQDHFKKADAILVGTSHTADAIPERWRSRCVVVPGFAVETDRWVPPPREESRERKRVLYAGRLTGHKGLELLVHALALVKDRADFEVRLIGRGTPFYESLLKNLAAELGLGDRALFIPPVPREALLAEVQSADVFCFPSLSDTYGVALLEAMSCARACVTADTGGPKDIVQPGCGIKIPLESPEQYVRDYGAAVLRLLQEPALRREIGGRARELMISRNRWEVVAGILNDVYDRVAARL